MGWDQTYFRDDVWEGLLRKIQATVFIELKAILSALHALTMLSLTTLPGNVPLLCPCDRRGNQGTETLSDNT